MATTTIKVEGLRQLGEQLRELSAAMAGKIAHSAVAAGAAIIKKRARQLAPVAPAPYEVEGNDRIKIAGQKGKRKVRTTVTVQPGNIAAQTVIKRVPKNQTTLTSEYVVAVRGKRQHGFASRIGSLQEFGTVKMPAQPFMRPAFEQEKHRAVEAIKDRLKKRIDAVNNPKVKP